MAQSSALLKLPLRRDNPDVKEPAPAALLTPRPDDLGLAERIERSLHATGYGALRGVAVSVHTCLVILTGRVPSYYLKQIAQMTVLAVPGVQKVRNDLDVVCPHRHA